MVQTTAADPSRSRMRSACGSIRGEEGQGLVEFALVLPILLLLVMGILWLGRAFNYSTDETHLANEAARYAAVNANPGSGTYSTLNDWILSQIDTSELKSGSSNCTAHPDTCAVPPTGAAAMTICYPNGTSNVGDPVKVSITSTFHFIPILKLSDITIRRSAVMRIEVPPSPTANYTAAASC